MSNEVRIRTSVQGGRGVIAQVDAIKTSFRQLQADLNGQNAIGFGQTLGKSIDNIGASISKLGSTWTRNVTLPIVGAGAAIAMIGKDFDTSLRQIVALTDTTQAEIGGVREQILKLASVVGKDPNELAKGFYFLASAGFDTAQAMDVLTQTAKASAAGLGDTADISKVVGAAINSFGKENLTATDAVDQLLRAVKDGTAEAPDFAAALGNVLATAGQMGSTFADTTAAIAAMTLKGVDADTAATNLNQIFVSLLKTTPAADKALADVGLSAEGLRQQIRDKGLLSVLQTLQGAFEGNDTAAAEVFGNVRALRGVLALTTGDAAQTAKVFQDVAGGTANMAEAFQQTEGPGREIDRAIVEIKTVLIDLSTDVLPVVVDVLKQAAGMIRTVADWFKSLPGPVRGGVVQLLAFAAAAGPVLLVLGKLTSGVGLLIKSFSGLAGIISRSAIGQKLGSAIGQGLSALVNSGVVKGGAAKLGGFLGTTLGATAAVGLAAALWAAAIKVANDLDEQTRSQQAGIAKSIASEVAAGNIEGLHQSKAAIEQAIRDLNSNAALNILLPSTTQEQRDKLTAQLDIVTAELKRAAYKSSVESAEAYRTGAPAVEDAMMAGPRDAAARLSGLAAKAGDKTAEQLMTGIATGIGKRQSFVETAMDNLRNLMENAIGRKKRVGLVIGDLLSKDLAKALGDHRSRVRHAAEQTQLALLAELEKSIENGAQVGKKSMDALRDALHSKNPRIRAAARAILKIIRDNLPDKGDGRDAGSRVGDGFAAGLESKIGAAARAALLISGKVKDILKTGSPSKEGPFSEMGGPEGWGAHWGDLYLAGMRGALSGMGSLVPATMGTTGLGGAAMMTATSSQPVVVQLHLDGRQIGEASAPVVTKWQQDRRLVAKG